MKLPLRLAPLGVMLLATLSGRGLAQGASGGAQAGPAATTPKAVVEQLGDAFNRRDWQTFSALVGDSIVTHQIGGTAVHRQSRAEFVNDVRKFVGANPQENRAVTNRIVAGRFVADYERTTGMADGRTKEGIDLFEVRDGHIVSEWETPLMPM